MTSRKDEQEGSSGRDDRSLPVMDTGGGGGTVSEGARAHAAAEAEAALAEAEAREGDRPDPEPIDLNENEQELLALELESVGRVPSEQRKAAYDALADAVDDGTVPEELVPLLERLVAVSLESGRARRRYLAEGEKILTDLFKRTPAGKELLGIIKGVNTALEILEGRTVSGVKVGLRTLGHMRISLETEDLKLTLAVRPSAVAVESMSVLGGKKGQ